MTAVRMVLSRTPGAEHKDAVAHEEKQMERTFSDQPINERFHRLYIKQYWGSVERRRGVILAKDGSESPTH